MNRTHLLAALLNVALATVATTAPAHAAPQAPRTGVSVSFDRHGVRGVSLDWSRGRDERIVRRPTYERDRCETRTAGYVTAGRYEWRVERVWVPASFEKVWHEPVVEVRYDSCGRRIETVVAPGRWAVETVPGHFTERKVRVWVPSRPSIARRY